ncbi:MAG TPA: ATP-binding protein [Humidesulfovibrio sp.]|uniref:ATP-binding protein n=1 Tax=Humidesulfovibrio sp. TaxID=2910988 RepID=UPI002BEFA5A2|nr:ATP-binding protein [Humidesulfovibrio sp.]HWR03424.1 ATP-binding protein [Humidesulfovibrio sp.]
MTASRQHNLILELPPDVSFLPAAAAAAENAAQVFGLDRGGALKLSLAVEEFFAYLCRYAGREEPLRLTFSQGGTFVRMAFRFRAGEVSLRALNFAASVDLEGEGGVESAHDEHDAELGLLVASRTTDRCSLESSGAGVYVLLAEVDRQYPEAEPLRPEQQLSPPVKMPSAEAGPPSEGQLRHAALLAAGSYPARSCPASFFRPARFADMVAHGQYQALLAQDALGRPAGLICWRGSGPKSVVFSGPYVFDVGPDRSLAKETARLLTEHFLASVARTEAVCAFSERATSDVPPGWFESLGSLTLCGDPDGAESGCGPESQPALFRHLREDVGGAVWAHPELMPFLERQYDSLAFSRDLLSTGERPIQRAPEHSLLATNFDRRRGLAILKPLLDGQDFAANLAAHVTALHEQNQEIPPDILLHLDLSEPWQAALYPAITACGFAPRLVLPHAGSSDLLVCQHVPAHR